MGRRRRKRKFRPNVPPLWSIFFVTSLVSISLTISILQTKTKTKKYNGPVIKRTLFYEEENNDTDSPLPVNFHHISPAPTPDINNPIINVVDKASLYFRLIDEGIPVRIARVLTAEPEPAYVYAQLNSNKSGVDKLEISPGVSVMHNFSATRSDRTFTDHDKNITIITFDSGFMKEHFLILPPFLWEVPRGLTKEQMKLYWLQPENRWHFCDTNQYHASVIWEIDNGIISFPGDRDCEGNHTHHLNFCHWPKQTQNPKFDKTVFSFGDHYIDIFQHFFDNGIPHMAAAQMATDMDPSEVEVITSACNEITLQIMERLGYKNVHDCTGVYFDSDPSSNYSNEDEIEVSASKLIIVPALSVIHPLFFNWYRDRIEIPNVKKEKIIFIPRGEGFGGGDARVIGNLLELTDIINSKSDIYVHKENNENLENLIDIFSHAKMIIGPHGGAFYNQFFAQNKIDIVEMIPMKKNGMYPSQSSWDGELPFAHLAMQTNTLLQNQRFYRYITYTDQLNYDIDVNDFKKWYNRWFT